MTDAPAELPRVPGRHPLAPPLCAAPEPEIAQGVAILLAFDQQNGSLEREVFEDLRQPVERSPGDVANRRDPPSRAASALRERFLRLAVRRLYGGLFPEHLEHERAVSVDVVVLSDDGPVLRILISGAVATQRQAPAEARGAVAASAAADVDRRGGLAVGAPRWTVSVRSDSSGNMSLSSRPIALTMFENLHPEWQLRTTRPSRPSPIDSDGSLVFVRCYMTQPPPVGRTFFN